MKKLVFLCLAILLLLIPIAWTLDAASETNHKIDELQKAIVELGDATNSLASGMSSIEALLKAIEEHEDHLITIVFENLQSPREEQPTEQPTEPPTEPPAELPTDPPRENQPANYYGRLVIPDAGISVGLYHGADPAITDREDSANLFSMRVFDGLYIADHNNQEFSKLYRVTVGMRGYIRTADDTVFNIVCTDIFNGHNNGKIIDEDGNTNFDAHFLMYTCRDHWTNILICLWKHY